MQLQLLHCYSKLWVWNHELKQKTKLIQVKILCKVHLPTTNSNSNMEIKVNVLSTKTKINCYKLIHNFNTKHPKIIKWQLGNIVWNMKLEDS
jgi:hypothetical protein